MRSFLTIILSVLLSVIAVCFIHPVTGNGQKKASSVYQKVLDKGVLRCGYAAWEPMLIIDPNTKKLSGISYDLMEEVGKKLGVKIEWTEETSWGEYPQGLENNRFDAFCVAGWPNSKRARVIQFTKPILFSPVNVYARADDTRFDADIDKINDPAVKTVYIEGTTPQLVTSEVFGNSSHHGLPELTPYASLFMDVVTKKADALVMDGATAGYFIKTNPGKLKAIPSGKAVRVFPNLFSVKSGEYELQQALDTVLYELNGIGTVDAIAKKYEPLPGTYYRLSENYKN